MKQLAQRTAILLPESLIGPCQIDGSLFLYFDDPLILPSPPLLVLPVVSQFLERMNRSPAWPRAEMLLAGAADYKKRAVTMLDVLKPLHGSAFVNVLMVYPAEVDQFDSALALLRSDKLTPSAVLQAVDERLCAAELLRHLGAMCASSHGVDFAVERAQLLLKDAHLREALAASALIRISLANNSPAAAVILSDPRLVQMLGSLGAEPSDQAAAGQVGHEAVAWEIFRQLLHSHTQPLTPVVVERVAHIRQTRMDAAKRLRVKCLEVARALGDNHDSKLITATAAELIEDKLQSEISELLEIDKAAVRKLIDELLSNDQVWLGVAAALGSLAIASPIGAGASGMALVALFGAEAYRQASARREKIKTSPFTLLYDLERRNA